MLNHRRIRLLYAVWLLLALSRVASAAVSVSVPDPAGDTLGVLPIQHDILSVTSTVNPTNLVFDVSFAGAIAPPSAFSPSSVVGFLDLDIDQNSATGVNARFGAPPTPTVIAGVELYIDLFSESFTPGMVDVVNASTGLPTGSAAISYGATTFSLSLPFSLIGGDDGFLNYGLVVGTFNEATDEATGSTGAPPPSDSVAEPASLVAWAVLSTIAGAYGFHRRRQRAGARD